VIAGGSVTSVAEAPRVKICGLTDPDEAAACANLDVWAIGLVFAEASPRHVSGDRAAAVAGALPDGVARVGVFVDPTMAALVEEADRCGLTHVQVHGATPPAAAIRDATGCAVIEAFSIAGPDDVGRATRSDGDLVILDAAVTGRHGGTGTSFDWGVLGSRPVDRPFVLAGGLTPENVRDAVDATDPWAVDVSSGVEWAPGRKDLELVAAFVAAARAPRRID